MNRVKKLLTKISGKKSTESDISKENLKVFIDLLRATGFSDFVRYLQSKRRILWVNFLAGMARGFGVVVGMTIVVAIIASILNKLVDFPLIGQYFLDLKQLLESVSNIR